MISTPFRFIENRNRICYCCGSSKTYTQDGYPKWFVNDDSDDNVLCLNCYRRVITGIKANILRFKFRNKILRAKTPPRTGYCSRCSNNLFDGSCKQTNIHHIKYDDSDPLANTIELCNACHNIADRELGYKKNRTAGIPKICTVCGSVKTRIVSQKGYTFPEWFLDGIGGVICSRCHKRKHDISFRHSERAFELKIRKLWQYVEWRNNIIKRDYGKCRNCGRQESLHIHHIIPFLVILRKYKIESIEHAIQCQALWDIENGITLCVLCHKKSNNINNV